MVEVDSSTARLLLYCMTVSPRIRLGFRNRKLKMRTSRKSPKLLIPEAYIGKVIRYQIAVQVVTSIYFRGQKIE